MTNLPRIRVNDLIVQDLDTEVLIYDLKINKAYCLNQTSSIIWHLCDGTKSVAEINESLSRQVNESVPEDLIWLALDQFKRNNLLEQSDKFEIKFNGLNRRQVVKKIGVASLVTLPVIASLTAPASGAAGSSCLSGVIGVCMTSGVEACPMSCPPGTPIMGTLYASMDGTCSGGTVGSFSGGCPSGFIFFDYTVN